MNKPAVTWWAVLVVVWMAAGVYAFANLNRGWVPHDEGQFDQSAERVLAGELPHRDFDEMYTGGLTHLNALAFRTFGVSVLSLRIVLFLFFLAWVPATYYVASRFGSPLLAGATTALAAVWSIPNYSSPVPSWYNLFFAVFGLAGLMRYLETDRRRWLFASGVCGGLSFLVKLVGAYYVLGVLLFLIYREQSLRLLPDRTSTRERYYSIALATGLIAFSVAVARTYRQQASFTEFFLFVAPNVGIALFLVWREVKHSAGSSLRRLRALLGMWTPFFAGVAAPVVVYLIPYATAGGLQAFVEGVFVHPGRRLIHATYPMPDLDLVLVAPMLALMLLILFGGRKGTGFIARVLAFNGLAFVLIASAFIIPVYWIGQRPAAFMAPLAVLAGIVHLRRPPPEDDQRPQRLMVILCVTAMCSLVQFPFPAPIYVCYIAPLAGLALTAVVAVANPTARPLGTIVLVFYAAFAVWRVTPGFIYAMGHSAARDHQTAPLGLPRAPGLRIQPEEAEEYARVIALVTHLANEGPVYAFPDCPEVYFLSGARNPARAIYEVLGDSASTDEHVTRVLANQHIHAIVINGRPAFSPLPSPQLVATLRERFPQFKMVGRFEVRWLE
ncbi:MAG TPA: hypothetical protein VES67_11530 [Vicinamibacterales bacterium]|nr:hypothetical protein [Vicinamibacterales bacterium]